MQTVTLSHYTLPDGPRVHQVMLGAMPICRETEDAATARRIAVDQLRAILRGEVAGTSPRRVSFSEWDGDLGSYISEDAEVFITDARIA